MSASPTRFDKLEAHAGHLLDAFLLLRERYSMLAPLLFDKMVIAYHGSDPKFPGFNTLLNSLFLSCAQDIATLSTDDDDRAPSIVNLVAALDVDEVRDEFRRRHAAWALTKIDESDAEIVAAIEKMQVRDRQDRAARFDELYAELRAIWSDFSASERLKAFRTIRDKVSSHVEIRYIADKYQRVDIASLGLKWGDLKATIETMQRVVEILGLLVRSAGFAWELHDRQLAEASREFWASATGAQS